MFSISAALLVTGSIATWTLLAIRARISAEQGLTATGHFDAAWAISMNQVTLVLASVQAYYLPSLARAVDENARDQEMARLLAVAPLCAAAVIAGIALWKSPLLGLLYSTSFQPASRYLRWTLLGDYLKVTSWILSLPLLAAGRVYAFVCADLAAYGTFAVMALILSRWQSAAESAAMGFVAMYAIHTVVCAGVWYRGRKSGPPVSARLAWFAGLSIVSIASTFAWNQT